MKQSSSPVSLDFTLHYGQSQAWRAMDTHRILSVFAGTGSGKSWCGPRLMYRRIRERPDATYLFIEPTYKMLKRVMLPIVRAFYDPMNLGTMRLGDMIYELRGGGRIIFASIDNPNSIQGVHVDGGIWADEIGLYSEEAWDTILQRSALHEVTVLNTSTPYTLPWCERRLANPARDARTADEYWLLQFPSYWNPQYPLKQYFNLKRQWPQDKFDRLMRGLFGKVSGLMFEEFDESRHLAWIEPREGNRLYFRHPIEGEREIEVVRTWCGQDWGWSPDPGVQLLLAQDGIGRMYVIEEDYETRIPVAARGKADAESWTGRALARARRWGIDRLWCDPSMPAYIADMASVGLPAEKANNAIDYGVSLVNEAFKDGRLYIAQNACPNLVRTIGTYVRQRRTDGEGYLLTPAPYQDDHACDALRYSLVGSSRARMIPLHDDPLPSTATSVPTLAEIQASDPFQWADDHLR